jgi:prepilin-type N-terminal cleavage/methylation domain-containing protein
MKNTKGFTLIELITTVAIIGILMLMAYPSYDSYVKRVKIVQELVLLQPIVEMQKMEIAMGGVLATTGKQSEFLTTLLQQQNKTSGQKGWLIGANNNPTCIDGNQYFQSIVQTSPTPSSSQWEWTRASNIGLNLDPTVTNQVFISGYSFTEETPLRGNQCTSTSTSYKRNSSFLYYIQLGLKGDFLNSNTKRYSFETNLEPLNIVLLTGGEKIFYDTNGKEIRKTSSDSTEMTCAVNVPQMANAAFFMSKVNKNAIPTHCRYALLNSFQPTFNGTSTSLHLTKF